MKTAVRKFLIACIASVVCLSYVAAPAFASTPAENAPAGNATESPERSSAAVDQEGPSIGEISAKPSYSADENVLISAPVTDGSGVQSVTLYYKQAAQLPYRTAEMKKSQDSDVYQVELSREETWSDQLTFYVEATDGEHTSKSAEKTARVEQSIDPENQPPLIVTEVMAYTKYRVDNPNDGMDFIEIYNNSSKPVNFGYYQLFYMYPSGTYKTWRPTKPDPVIQPGETLTIMIGSATQTIKDFNDYYGTDLKENEDIVRVEYGGLHERDYRKLILGHTIDDPVSFVEFNMENQSDTTPDPETTIHYRYPMKNEISGIRASAAELAPTPGNVYDWQVSGTSTSKTGYEDIVDKQPLVVSFADDIKSIDEGKELKIALDLVEEDSLVNFELNYRTNGEDTYRKTAIDRPASDGHYYVTIPSNELVGKNYIEFYAEAADLFHDSVRTAVKRVTVNRLQSNEPLSLNVEDGDLLSDVEEIVATTKGASDDTSLFLDKERVTTRPTLEKGAFFTLSYSGIDSYFKDAVTIGDDTLSLIVKGDAPSRSVFIPKSYFTEGPDGSLKVTVTVRAGTHGSPYESDNDVNNDDIKATGFQMMLPDGTAVAPDESVDPDKTYRIGDSKGMVPYLDIPFTISADKLRSSGYRWNTADVKEGSHRIKAVAGDFSKEVHVVVDNTAPEIDPRIKDQSELRGTITLDPKITDANGVDAARTFASLDGEEIKLPFETSSGRLTPGKHTFKVVAADKAGNESVKTVTFTTPEENPDVAQKESDDAVLSVVVNDPNGDASDVTFKEGNHYTVKDGTIDVFEGSGDFPNASGTLVDKNEAVQLESIDGKSVTTKTDGELPFQKFDVSVGDVQADDRIEVKWNGRVTSGREARMYVLNHETRSWEEVAGKTDGQGEMSAHFQAAEHVKDGKASLLVQDRLQGNGPQTSDAAPEGRYDPSWNPADWNVGAIPNQYDFTFGWITDTQYYAQTYTDHFNQMNKWIVDNKDDLNMKYLFHTGDVVNVWNMPYQWVNATQSMDLLDDSGLPYGVLAGNHDVGHGREDFANYTKYFGAWRYQDRDYYEESYKNNLGHYDLISAGGVDFIMIYMSWDVYHEEIDWINEVLAKYPNRKAILNFHRNISAKAASDYTGDMVEKEIVEKNPNVFAVLNGHYHGAAIKINRYDDNGDGTAERPVYNICTDYQSAPEGGQQYIKLLYVDLANNKIYVNSYSPLLNDYNFFDEPGYYENGTQGHDTYVLDVDFGLTGKELATDRFEVNVYTDKVIGEVKNVKSGETASVEWEDLTKGQTYGWYTEAADKNSGSRTSMIKEFVFNGKNTDTDGDGTPDHDPDDDQKPGDDQNPDGENPGGDQQSGDDREPDANADENGKPDTDQGGEDLQDSGGEDHDPGDRDDQNAQPDDSDKEASDERPDQTKDPNENQNKEAHQSGQDYDLPNTALPINWMVLFSVGFLTLVMGCLIYALNRKFRVTHEK